MFSGFGSGRRVNRPGNSGNVPQQTPGARGAGDRMEADTEMTADPPADPSASLDVPILSVHHGEEPRFRPQTWHLRRRDQEVLLERLRSNAEAALRNAQDVQLQDIIQRSHEEINQMPDRSVPTLQEATVLVARMLDLANQRLEPRQAAIYLAYTHWNYKAAVERYIEERFGDDGGSLSDAEDSLSDPELDSEDNAEEGGGDGEAEDEHDSDVEDYTEDHLAQMRRLNQHLDRRGPIKGQRNDSLLVIRLRNPGGRPDTVRYYRDSHPGPVDWDRDVRAISRWRSQVFRRALGGVREGRTKYHELEKQFLVDAHIEFGRQCRAAGSEPNWRRMDWRQLAIDFNRRFQGQILPGEPLPRPARTALSLRNERARIKAITDLTGLKPKDQTK